MEERAANTLLFLIVEVPCIYQIDLAIMMAS